MIYRFMKKAAYIFLLSLWCCNVIIAQTIVSTLPQNKKAVLEEYGGIYCVYCPEGNIIAESIVADYPGQVMRINIQEGIYANPEAGDPDFRSDYGGAYVSQTGLIGFPAGTVNRQVFPGWEQGDGGTTALGRSSWSYAVSEVLNESAVVNIAAEATVDYETNELEILVEIYYTGNIDNATHFLNIALLQNGVYGPQLGGNEGVNYQHNHLLRDMVTGQWGDPVYTSGQGYFEARTYTYQLPPDYRDVPFDSPNMELVVFITETHQHILNGVRVIPDFIVQNAYDANALLLPSPEIVCGNNLAPLFTLRNDGNQPLTNLDIEYRVNDETLHTYEWTGYLNTFETEEVALPAIDFEGVLGEDNYLNVAIHQPNEQADENYDNNEVSTVFRIAPPSTSNNVTLELKTDAFGFDIYWEITDESGAIIAYGGNENVGENGGGTQTGSPADPGAYDDNQAISEFIELPGPGCYNFRILDDYGDGLCCQYGYGFYYLQDEAGNIIFTGGEFGIEKQEPFSFGDLSTATAADPEIESIALYPNPVVAGEYLTYVLSAAEITSLTVELFSADQRISRVITQETSQNGLFSGNIDTGGLTPGLYLLKFSNSESSITRKVVVLR
jgi:hypothetical protein